MLGQRMPSVRMRVVAQGIYEQVDRLGRAGSREGEIHAWLCNGAPHGT